MASLKQRIGPSVGNEPWRHLPHAHQGLLQHRFDIDPRSERTQAVAQPSLREGQPAGEDSRVAGANAGEQVVFARELYRIRHEARGS